MSLYSKETILNCLKNSNLSIKDIDLIIPHGTGTTITDMLESRFLMEVFPHRSTNPLISAFKPYVGHNLGGSTLLETCILLLCLQNNGVLPILNTTEFRKEFSLNFVTKFTNKRITNALKTCSAFAGFNAACAFRKW